MGPGGPTRALDMQPREVHVLNRGGFSKAANDATDDLADSGVFVAVTCGG